MPRDRDLDTASSSGQSKRASQGQLSQLENDPPSDSPSTSTSTATITPAHSRQKLNQHQKHHPVGRFHARVPSSKALHKHHGPPGAKLTRRITSPPPELDPAHNRQALAQAAQQHRRTTSEVKLPRASSSGNIASSASHSNLKRNRSHAEVGKRVRSSDKLKRLSNGSNSNRPTSSKSQVHFDIGDNDNDDDDDDQEDEWVDASGSNSPYMSRKGSVNSSSFTQKQSDPEAHSSHNGHTNGNGNGSVVGSDSRPQTPQSTQAAQPDLSTPERERVQHKEYLTTRLLQRTPSHGAPPQMTTDMARVASLNSPTSGDHTMVGSTKDTATLAGSNRDDLTSRFVEGIGSGESSFVRPRQNDFPRSNESPRRPRSSASMRQVRDSVDPAPFVDADNSALVPRPGRRTAAPSAETSRVQQKLNLQRASSAIEPGQTLAGVGGVIGANPLIGVGGPGYDGGNSRDPRVGKLLERTGMEYLVVRRYQNPVARSLSRLSHLPGIDKSKRIPRLNTGSTSSRRSVELPIRHARNISQTDPRRPVTPRRPTSIKANGAGSSFEDDESRIHERLSGSSLVDADEEDGTTALLRNLWEKSLELSASTD
ncbi:hypothetical protein B0I35DRAFT_352478 [Stachybotrys elegans]|uniref:Uncharacterized protein n=1 Tax=Stachybotrys elegans TaxID=80388 RepID=A0A8K0SQW5_9HYPO|nr:hypothetical protein B0I35DRAFT_352478 [Stachybotrys elegans]